MFGLKQHVDDGPAGRTDGSGPSSPRLRLTRIVALITLIVVLPAAGAATSGSSSASSENLVLNPSFEAGLTHWAGYRGKLARVSGGADGASAASVTATESANWWLYPTTRPVLSSVAGTEYRATAAVRKRSGARQVCLRVREWADGTSVAYAEACVTPSGGWRTFPTVAYTARRSGSTIEAYAYGVGGRRGDSFDVDAFTMTATAPAQLAPPPPPPTEPPPPATPSPSPSLAVSLTAPTATTVARTVTLAAAVTSGAATRVEFLVAGSVVGSDTTEPYSLAWNSASRADGDVSLAARAVGSSGETAVSTARSVRVDNTAPDTTISSGPSGTTTTGDASFAFAAGEPSSFECALNGGAWAACSSPKAFTGLANGTYTFGVRAADAAGNVDGTPATRTWTVALAQTAPAPAPSPSVTCNRVAATNGSDSNAGTLAAPYRTPQKLADTLAAGETGCLRGGSYASTGTYVLNVARVGFTIRSYPGERATLIGITMVRNGADRVTLSNLDFEGDATMNTIKVHSADVVLEDNLITNKSRGWSCLILGDNAGWGAAVRTIVRRNRFFDCGSTAMGNKEHAIYAANYQDGEIRGNVFSNTAAYAIHLYPNAQRNRVVHNVIDGGAPSVRGGLIFAGDSLYTSNNNIVEQNVIAYSQSANVETWWETGVGSGNIVRRNCVWAGKEANIRGSGFTATDNLVADPLFVNRAARDYRLSSSSPCRAQIDGDPAALLR